MTAVVVVGTQWGDEGKGKMIDYLASEAQMVIRCQGGSNAGHTVVSGDDVYKLHLVPSGILYPGVSCIIGNGVVIDVATILDELDGLKERGIDGKNLSISDRAQMIMPYHIRLDAMQEDMKGENKIGTTKKGIGPAYVDKYARTGLRIGDLLDWPAFLAKLHQNVVEKNHLLTSYGLPPVDEKEIADLYVGYRERILPYIADTAPVINASIDKGDKVLFEGAQGTLLDIDHGTYPFVTSSYPTAGGVCIGAGVGPTKIDKVLGITKAYTTRVGDGPFPCELHDKMGDVLRSVGQEFGVTTGRPRRCGWLDMVILRYSAMINGLTDIALTKLDILDTLPEIKICVAYEYQGKKTENFPGDLDILAQCKPVYETVSGWQADTTACRNFEELPVNAQKYVHRIEELCGVKVSTVAVGAKRDQTIKINELF